MSYERIVNPVSGLGITSNIRLDGWVGMQVLQPLSHQWDLLSNRRYRGYSARPCRFRPERETGT